MISKTYKTPWKFEEISSKLNLENNYTLTVNVFPRSERYCTGHH